MLPIPEGDAGEALMDKYFPSQEWEQSFQMSTQSDKTVSNYTGINFIEIEQLPYIDYLKYRRDAWIYQMQASEHGQEFLKVCWRLQQTKADVQAIRTFNKERGA